MGTISFKEAKVLEVINRRNDLTEVKVELEGEISRAINYDQLTGDIKRGDKVVLNTTAVELELGTGGKHFVLWNYGHRSTSFQHHGHIMKLRYTPLQLRCLSVEEQESPFHHLMRESMNLEGMPVIVGTLHSQLPAVVTTVKAINGKAKMTYIMTDGAALPIAFSNLVHKLKSLKLLDATVTIGHAFGGDLEAVNIFSGLIACRVVIQADITVVIMGPGTVGTDTHMGFSAMEQGQIINAVASLNGCPIAIPRIGFKDKRARHIGVSHHTITALSKGALVSCVVTLPRMSRGKMEMVLHKLKESGIASKHRIEIIENGVTLEALKRFGFDDVTTMGRGIEEEPEFFQAAGAAGIYALSLLK
ncbi:MAG: DUF3866 family protein [Actinomycetota bacterium]|nr:DUF3866 family protein [Actinomycetota bacterium]